MAYIRFKGEADALKASVIPNGNIVTLKFVEEKRVRASGFDLFLDKQCKIDIGGNSYSGFTTIYRNDEVTEAYNGYQLSNDGSVFVAQEQDEPGETAEIVMSLEELKDSKVAEMNAAQQQAIQMGIDVTLGDGSVERFSLTENDQTSLIGLQARVAAGDELIPWHTSDQEEHCKYYSNEDMARITKAALSYVSYHVTYFRDLRIYIHSMLEREEVEGTFYGIVIPDEYQSEPLKDMTALANA